MFPQYKRLVRKNQMYFGTNIDVFIVSAMLVYFLADNLFVQQMKYYKRRRCETTNQ